MAKKHPCNGIDAMTQTQKQTEISRLETRIARARKRLQTLWNAKGFTDAEVLNASIELDLLINEYLRLSRVKWD